MNINIFITELLIYLGFLLSGVVSEDVCCKTFLGCTRGNRKLEICFPLHCNQRKSLQIFLDSSYISITETMFCRMRKTDKKLNENSIVYQNSECPKVNPWYPIYLPHPSDCNLFYECSNGEKVLQVCPPGLYFSSRKNTCDLTDRCQNIQSDHGFDALSSKQLLKSINGISRYKDPIASSTHRNSLRFNNLSSHFQALKLNKDLKFSPNTSNCKAIYEWNTGQNIMQRCLPEDILENIISILDEAGYLQVESHNLECPDEDPWYRIYLPHPEDCKLFYECSNGEKILHTCPPGLLFNSISNRCVYVENGECILKTKNKNKEHEINIVHKDAGNGNNSNTTVDETTNVQTEHTNGLRLVLHLNLIVKICSFINCTKSILIVNKEGVDGENAEEDCPEKDSWYPLYYPHLSDCRLFYKCYRGSKILQTCPPGLYFNEPKSACDVEEDVDCRNN